MANKYVAAQPIEFKDFSGGITDNFLQGDPKRCAVADNFLLTEDSKARVRDGTKIYDPTGYYLSVGSRVGGLFTAINETYLFGHANRDFYLQNPQSYNTAWSRVTGPTGNEALGGGTGYNQVTTAEFQRQIYYTSDFLVKPGKIFRDQTNTWKVVTAGLPKMAWTPNYPNNASLLPACIELANNLRASMIAHYNDYAGSTTPSFIYQHKYKDKYSLSYFEAITDWAVGDPYYSATDPLPTPTPAPAATNEATLYALCAALASSYEFHRDDLSGDSPNNTSSTIGLRAVHQSITIKPTGFSPPFGQTTGTNPTAIGSSAKLGISGVVNTLREAAAFLDELSTKWYWHQLSPFSHSPSNDLAQMSRHTLAASGNNSVKIGTIYSNPYILQVTPNYEYFIDFATAIKTAMNRHAEGLNFLALPAAQHGQEDLYSQITLADPVDFDSAALVIFWARYLYGSIHIEDSNKTSHIRVTFTTVAGNFSINTVANSGGAYDIPVDHWLITETDVFDDPNPVNRRAARVRSSGGASALLTRAATAGAAGVQGQVSTSWFHGSFVDGDLANSLSDVSTSTATPDEFIENYAQIGTDLASWVELGTEFILCLGYHEANGDTGAISSHYSDYEIYRDFSAVIPQVVNYAWAAFYNYRYTVDPGGILYINSGSPVYSNSIQTCASYPIGTTVPSINEDFFPDTQITEEVHSATLVGIPGLINTSTTNYDTTVSVVPVPETDSDTGYLQNLTIDLYRTTDGGTAFYFLDSLANPSTTTTYEDVTNENYPLAGDTALNLRQVMYTTGGVLGNDQPPECKYIHTVEGYAYYGNIIDTGQYFPNRIVQSLQNAFDSAPATNYIDLEDEITGLSSARNNLIALCKNSVYRVSGAFTSTGQGGMVQNKISDEQGCLNSKSVVKTEIGVFYAGTDGFYYTDGYQIIKISLELDKTYQNLTRSDSQKSRIYGCYDKLTRRIWWAMQSQESSTDCDVLFVYYLNYGVKPSGVFTKVKTRNSWTPSSVAFFKGRMIIGDAYGYVFKSDPDAKTDPKIVRGSAASTWITSYIPWEFKSCALDMGSSAQRKWITKIHMVGQNIGNVALQINSINDSNAFPTGDTSNLPLAVIQYTKNKVWGDPTVVWGDSSYDWKYDGSMDVFRRFPSRTLRSNFKQVQFLPADVVVYNSDSYPDFAYANVNAGALTATLVTPSGYSSLLWPLDVVDYYISFNTDDYSTEYLITALDATKKIITFTDPSGTIQTNTTAYWEISGVKKEQRLKITAFDIHASFLGSEFESYPGRSGEGGLGANA